MGVGQERPHACQAPYVFMEAPSIAGVLGLLWADLGHLKLVRIDRTLLRSTLWP